ncbi:MAG: hypothetical protein ACI82Z_001959 [Cellvibrionaceae bacterium]|jgi:uncharacterized protein with NRDE domain
MCLILFSFQPSTDRPLVLGANRDEFFDRPTAPADYWEDTPKVLAGRDLLAGGTWLGITASGRFAAVTNVREPQVVTKKKLLSRGDLTRHFLQGDEAPQAYLKRLSADKDNYAGFNLLLGDFSDEPSSIFYFSNRCAGIHSLTQGTYGLSNHLLDSPWPKVDDGKTILRQGLKMAEGNHDFIRDLLERPSTAEDDRLPDTGVSYAKEKALSAIFIANLPNYGTRASSVLTIDYQRIKFSEQDYRVSEDGSPNPDGPARYFQFDRTNPRPVIAGVK